MPAIAPSFKESVVGSMGEKPYRGVFALLIVGSLALIVFGWRSTPEDLLYVLPAGTRMVAFALICISFIVIGSAHHPSRIKRIFRHPMLTGVFIWAAAHLLVNGTTRALVLFGGLGIWALLEIVLINKRDGAYTKPDKPGFSEELKGTFFSAGILLIILFLHPYFAGVTPFPR
jgi:uncharacterized membrane protein